MAAEILTDEDKRAVLEQLEALTDVERQIALAKQAGLDVAEQDAQAKTLRQQLEGIRRVYIGAAGIKPTRAR